MPTINQMHAFSVSIKSENPHRAPTGLAYVVFMSMLTRGLHLDQPSLLLTISCGCGPYSKYILPCSRCYPSLPCIIMQTATRPAKVRARGDKSEFFSH